MTLHEDNRVRTWNILDGKCMCASLPELFSTRIECFQTGKFQRYIYCIDSNSRMYLLDLIIMKVIKLYTSNNMEYKGHCYMSSSNSIWLLDSHNSLFFWRLEDKDDIKNIKKFNKEKKKIPKQSNNLPLTVLPKECEVIKHMEKVADNNLIIVFDKFVYIIEDIGARVGREVKVMKKHLENVEGELLLGNLIERQKLVAFLTSELEVHYIELDKLLNSSINTVDVKMKASLKGFYFVRRYHVIHAIAEMHVLVMPTKGQNFISWNLSKIQDEHKDMEFIGDFQKPWKKLASTDKSQVRMNTYIKNNISVFQDNEILTTSLISSYKESVSPLYITGTNKGNVYIFSIFMKDVNTMFPVLKIEGSSMGAINRLYIKQGKLIISHINGSLSLADITIKKLQRAYKTYFSEHYTTPIFLYRDMTSHLELIPRGIRGFLEIHDLSKIDLDEIATRFQIIEPKEDNDTLSFCRENIGVIGCDNSLLIVSLFTSNVIHKYKGHDSKIVGLYINDVANTILVITKNGTVYVYSMASRILERKVRGAMACDIFDLRERNNKFLRMINVEYEKLFKIYMKKEITLEKGRHKAIDFCYIMEGVQTNWRNPAENREAIYRTVYYEVVRDKDMSKEELDIKVFNEVTNFEGKLHINRENTIGYTSMRMKLGKKTKKAEKAETKKRKGTFSEINKSNVIIIEIEDLLSNLRRNFSVENKNTIFALYNAGVEEEKKDSNNKAHNSSKCKEVNSIWPLPLVSLIHGFGANKAIDQELGHEFCICPPLLQLWVGIPGVEGTFSFTVPEVFDSDWDQSQGLYNWKVSPYLNSIQCAALFTSLVSIFHVNEAFIATIINRLLTSTIEFLGSNKMLPYISFMRLGGFLNYRDSDIWCTSRDIVLKPFLKNARPETFMNLTTQISELVDHLCDRIKYEPNYTNIKHYLREKDFLVKFEGIRMLNNYFGAVELGALMILCYAFNERSDLVASPKTMKRCTKIICLLIGYILILINREILMMYNKIDYKYPLINLLMTIGNNASSLKFALKKYIYQLFHQLIHIIVTTPKAKSESLVLVLYSSYLENSMRKICSYQTFKNHFTILT